MASPQGLFTKEGRCYPYWKDYQFCTESALVPTRECALRWEDYLECLHSTKQKEKLQKIAIEAHRIKEKEDILAQAKAASTKPVLP